MRQHNAKLVTPIGRHMVLFVDPKFTLEYPIALFIIILVISNRAYRSPLLPHVYRVSQNWVQSSLTYTLKKICVYFPAIPVVESVHFSGT